MSQGEVVSLQDATDTDVEGTSVHVGGSEGMGEEGEGSCKTSRWEGGWQTTPWDLSNRGSRKVSTWVCKNRRRGPDRASEDLLDNLGPRNTPHILKSTLYPCLPFFRDLRFVGEPVFGI